MSKNELPEVLEEYLAAVKEREQQRPRRERLQRKGRVRNKYRLLKKWQETLAEYDGPGEAELVDGYRPSGVQAPVDVPEIAGLIVWDPDGRAHHFRLYRDETVAFIESPEDPNAPITIDPVEVGPDDTVYLSDGPSLAALDRLDAMDVTPKWSDARQDRHHDFEIINEGTGYEYHSCRHCENSRATLSWLGHAVPTE